MLMGRRAFLGALLAVFPGMAVAHPRITTPGQFGFYEPPTQRVITIRVAFLDENPPEMQTQGCRGGGGCYLKGADEQPDLVMVPRPKDFEDEYALYVLGHEVLHALGAKHG